MGSFSLIFLVFGILLGLTFTTAQICSTTGNFTANSTYGKNRDLILSSLPSNVSANGGFFRATMGEGADRVYALGLCRGDASTELCYNSINSSSQSLINTCTKQKEALVWGGDPVSIVRYSDRNFFGKMELSPQAKYYNTSNASWNQFEQIWSGLVNDIASRAAVGSSRLKFATQEANVTGFVKIYGLVQCTPDLSLSQCTDCLIGAIGEYRTCCDGHIGGGVNKPSCMFRFDLYRFYESTPAGSAPPPPPPPIRNYPPLPLTDVTNKKDNKSSTSRTIVVIVVPTVISLMLIAILFAVFRKKKPNMEVKDGDTNNNVKSLLFDLSSIKAATNYFSDANKLGEGGFGSVYKGLLSDGQEIAVKRLKQGSSQGELEFKNEIVTMARLQHRNLVSLQGFCLEGRERLLIYEFMRNGSLDRFIFDPVKRLLLNWESRYKIIRSIARGMLYLHQDSQLKIIHRDLKATNVLLDGEMNAKISDFGIARLFLGDQSQGNTKRIVGTHGYMAPEYARDGHISVKADVFSFGVLILEIVSGKKNSFVGNSGCVEHLSSYAWKKWRQGAALKLMDPTMKGGSRSEILRCIQVGLLCIQENVERRPTMASVVLMLSSNSTTLPTPSQPAFVLYNSRESNVENILGRNGSHETPSQPPCPTVNEVSLTELHPR